VVAVIEPVPDIPREAPVPTTIAAVVLVDPVMAEKVVLAPVTEITPAAHVVPVPHSRTPNTEADPLATVIAPAVSVIIVPSGLRQPITLVVPAEQLMVPVVVIGPPVSPVPVAILVTVPVPAEPELTTVQVLFTHPYIAPVVSIT
jgi:hypothetical protein